jgi:2-polyprenyl-3-methyl-5-hydroxy-6-metoxy-1,4-benzoquinol methylase
MSRNGNRPEPVPASAYSASTVVRFAGPDYRDFVATGGERLRPRLAHSLDLAALFPGCRVLDLGCGRGETAVHAAMRGAQVTALDYSADCLHLTREAASLVGAHPGDTERGRELNVQLAMADATALPFADSAFDRVLMLDVVEHLYQWQLEATMREVRRVLAPDGFAVIHTLPNRWALTVGYPLLRVLRPSLPRDPRTDYEHEVHVNEQDIVGLSRTLQSAGLEARVWLENLTIEQARWQPQSDAFPDVRGPAYRLLRKKPIRALAQIALRTPLRLIACNDIFAIARPAATARG